MSSNQGEKRVKVRGSPVSQVLRYARLDQHLNVYVLSLRSLPVRISVPLEQTRLTPESVLNDGLQFRAGGLDLRLEVWIDPLE